FYSPETGIYTSKYPSVNLPSSPNLDVVSYIFSHRHGGGGDDAPAVIDSSSGISITHSTLRSLVKTVASGMHSIGVQKGDAVMILLPNSPFFPVVFLAALSLGAVAAPANPLCSLPEIGKQAVDCMPAVVFTVQNRAPELADALPGCRIIGVDIDLDLDRDGRSGIDRGTPESDFRKLIRRSDPRASPNPEIRQRDVAAILYSSGTTGRPKGTLLTHGNFIAAAEVFVRFEASNYRHHHRGFRAVHLAVMPMFHIYGLSLFVVGLPSLGSTVVAMRRFDGEEMAKAVYRYGVTHIHTVPPMLSAMTKLAKRFTSYGGNLKQVICGATLISKKIIHEFLQAFPHVDFIQGYGMTETTAIGTRGYNNGKFRKYLSAGLLAPNIKAKVVDVITGSCLPPGSIGELWLDTPGNMKGYLNSPEETSAVLGKDGWLRTGDIVYLDEDGYLFVIDRLKDVIKYKGYQISPAELEAVLMAHPEVVEAAVTGITDNEAGEIPVAFVVLKKGSSISEAALVEYVSKYVAPHKKVRRIHFRDSIPKSPAGKILKRELR
ncbi:hypothetical protein M569_02598, partial [Genlisea aurea]